MSDFDSGEPATMVRPGRGLPLYDPEKVIQSRHADQSVHWR